MKEALLQRRLTLLDRGTDGVQRVLRELEDAEAMVEEVDDDAQQADGTRLDSFVRRAQAATGAFPLVEQDGQRGVERKQAQEELEQDLRRGE